MNPEVPSAQREIEFVLGTAQLRGAYGVLSDGDGHSERDAHALIDEAGSVNVAALDTAPAYGAAEASIGSSGTHISVHTKLDGSLSPLESVTRSLGHLRRSWVDLLYIHDSAEVLDAQSAVIAAAHELVGHQVGVLGASIYSVEEFDAAMEDRRIGAIQAPINVLDRHIDPARTAAAAERGIKVYARSVLLQGLLAAPGKRIGAAPENLQSFLIAFRQAAQKLHRSTVELALGWMRSYPGLSGVVIGAESVEELQALVGAIRAPRLAAEELSLLAGLPLPLAQDCDPRVWS